MLQDESIDVISEALAERMAAVNEHYLTMIGKQLKEIGTLSPTNLHRLEQMMRMGANIEVIQRELAAVTAKEIAEIKKLLDAAALENYADASIYYEAQKISQLPLAENAALLRVIRAIEKETLEEFVNLSQTTIVNQTYRNAVDNAITALQSGSTYYHKAIRQTVRETAQEGLRVYYPNSGLTRRLDAAVSMNVLDGTRKINQGVQEQIGREIGADGVEISAHAICAEDHADYQGKQMTLAKFEKLQGSLPRPIGEWNCRHVVFYIILGVSAPAHSSRELKMMNIQNDRGFMYGGKHYTMYEATQEQRKIELAMRYGRDLEVIARASGDIELATETHQKINMMRSAYKQFSTAAGIPTRLERTRIIQ